MARGRTPAPCAPFQPQLELKCRSIIASCDFDRGADKLAFQIGAFLSGVVPLAFAATDFVNKQLTVKTAGLLPF